MSLRRLTTLFFAASLVSPLLAQQGEGTRRALLIGIDAYDHVPKLRGCVNDTRLVANLLETRHGFTDVRTLLDHEATREGILAALRDVVRDTARNDVLHIHYSGHGAQVFDVNEDEDDGKDETLVPQNGRDPDERVADVVDDEIDRILSGCRTRHVTVVIDACHSGSVLRDVGSRVRMRGLEPDDARLGLYLRMPQTRDVVDSDTPYTIVTSARADQKALDGPVDGTYHGLFTAAWVRAMSDAGRDASVLDIHRAAGTEYGSIVESLRALHLASTPVLEATRKRREQAWFPPLPRGTATRRPFLEVAANDKPGAVVLKGGASAGATLGSAWAVFRADDRDFRPGSAVALGFVRATRGEDAVLQIERRADGVELTGCRATRLAPAPASRRLNVRIAGGAARDQERLETELRSMLPGARVVSNGDADFVVQMTRGDHRVYGPDGEQEIARIAGATDARRTASVLARSLARTDFLSLDNHASSIGLRVWHDRNDGLHTTTRDIEVMATGGRGTPYVVYEAGDPVHDRNCFLLNAEVDRDCYLTVVNVDDRGKVSQLFPNSISEETGYYPDGLVTADEPVRIPDVIDQENRAGFVLPYRRAGHEVVRVFACEDLATANRIRKALAEIAERNADLDPEDFEAADNRRDVLDGLRSYLLATATRDIGIKGLEIVRNRPRPSSGAAVDAQHARNEESKPAGDWTAASVSVEVKR